MTSPAPVTMLLQRWATGDAAALDELLPLLYEELKTIALGNFRSERAGHTLQPTALVNEAVLRLMGGGEMSWQNRRHFVALMATTMRRVLVDYARSRGRSKRGGERVQVTLAQLESSMPALTADMLDLDRALGALAQEDPRKAEIIELHYFGGLSYPEIAQTLDLSEATVDRELRFSKAWLNQKLQAPATDRE